MTVRNIEDKFKLLTSGTEFDVSSCVTSQLNVSENDVQVPTSVY